MAEQNLEGAVNIKVLVVMEGVEVIVAQPPSMGFGNPPSGKKSMVAAVVVVKPNKKPTIVDTGKAIGNVALQFKRFIW